MARRPDQTIAAMREDRKRSLLMYERAEDNLALPADEVELKIPPKDARRLMQLHTEAEAIYYRITMIGEAVRTGGVGRRPNGGVKKAG